MTNDQPQLRAFPFACDVYSYGILAWQVLTGAKPYAELRGAKGVGAGEALRRIAAGLRPALPARAAALLVEERNQREERQEPGPGQGQIQEEEGQGEGQEERQMGCPGQGESQDKDEDEDEANLWWQSSMPVWMLIEECWDGRPEGRPAFDAVLKRATEFEPCEVFC